MDKMKYNIEPPLLSTYESTFAPQQRPWPVTTPPKGRIMHESFSAKIPDKKTFNESGTNSALNKTTIDDTSVASKMKNFTITVYIKPYLISRHVIKYELPMTTEIIRTKYLNYLQNSDKSKLPGTRTPHSYSLGNPFFTLVLQYQTIIDLASVELAQLTVDHRDYNFNNKDFLKQVNTLLLLIEATK